MTADATPIQETICSSFPPLDPNGQPFSMMLRGSVAELGELRSLLMDKSTREQLMQPTPPAEESAFADVETCDPVTSVNAAENRPAEDEKNSSCKRRRDDTDDASNDDEYDDEVAEDLLLFLPSVQCNCSSWDIKNVQGDLIVTSIRVLFIAAADGSSEICNDIAIDGRCIALHAVDSESSEDQEDSLPHVYCQLSDGDENNDAGFGGTAMSMGFGASANVMDDDGSEGDDKESADEGDMPEDNGVVELYFKPILSEVVADKEQHSNACQRLFEALTKLASLNPMDDSDGGGGGLFNMLSLMAGMGEGMVNAYGDSDDDDMVIRLGGSSNNIVEDDASSQGAPENERQAMLDRLDNMLVVPPEYVINSDEEEGRFDDADEDDDNLL